MQIIEYQFTIISLKKTKKMSIKNKVQLITYPDSLGGNLQMLEYVLETHFPNTFQGGIHILPPFPSSGDRGFAPLTYFKIDPKFGTWAEVSKLAAKYDLLIDFMVNHISKESIYFQDFLKNGKASKYSELFITLDKIWQDGKPVQADIEKMFLRREKPFSEFKIEKNDHVEKVWTTFGKQDPSEQIDFDIESPLTRALFSDFMNHFKKQNIKIVRLDAVGFVNKKIGTSSFFVEPEIYEFLEWIQKLAQSLEIELLPEIHSHYSIQYRLAEKGYWIYDFILPYFVLETLINKSAKQLVQYLRQRPHNQFTMLDCHDGIPIKPDLDDLVDSNQARKTVDVCLKRGANLSLIFSNKHKSADGFDVHQIRGSYYSLLNCNDDAYIAARAIQFFTPGIPQVYYVGLLAGENDIENVQKTGEGREINRHNFTLQEIEESVSKPIVKRLLNLIDFRNEYPAFNGTFQVEDSSEKFIHLSWHKDLYQCQLKIDLNTYHSVIYFKNESGETSTLIL